MSWTIHSPYTTTGLVSDPHTRRDTTVRVEMAFADAPLRAEDVDRDEITAEHVALIDEASGDDLIELPRTRPAPHGTDWVIDLAPTAIGAQAWDDALRTILREFGWSVL